MGFADVDGADVSDAQALDGDAEFFQGHVFRDGVVFAIAAQGGD